MPLWMIWAIVAGIGIVSAIIIHALTRQAQGAGFFGELLFGLIGALLAAWILPRLLNIPAMTLNEERFLWAAVGGLLFSLLYELAAVSTHRSKILIPAVGRSS